MAEKVKPIRDDKGRVVGGGPSLNPGGRPKADVRVTDLCRVETEASVRTLVALRDSEDTPPQTRAWCANALIDRGWGKAPAVIDLNVSGDHRPPREKTREELLREIEEYERRVAEQRENPAQDAEKVH